ncbi:MAG: alanine racemase, partial [Chlamydiia bacterium]|nr:alanine racemase [Chlamydiia bacterium]
MHPAWIEIDTAQFRKNLRAIRRKIGHRSFCLPVKADAYGHGLCPIAKIAEEEGIDILGVACLQEALALRHAGIRLPILHFGAICEEQIDPLLDCEVELTISSKYKAALIAKRCQLRSIQCKVHIEVDTGMRRSGVKPESVAGLLAKIEELKCFEVVGIYSHFATADKPCDPCAFTQIDSFTQLLNQLGPFYGKAHLANSGGVAYYPDSWLDMVRPGLLAYGYFPNGEKDPEGDIAPCLSLHAEISYFKVIGRGEGVSYGHVYKTTEESRIVTVPVGYGDGYRRILWNQASVLIREERFPIA